MQPFRSRLLYHILPLLLPSSSLAAAPGNSTTARGNAQSPPNDSPLPSIPETFKARFEEDRTAALLPFPPFYLAGVLASTHIAVNAPERAFEGRTYGVHAHGGDRIVQIVISQATHLELGNGVSASKRRRRRRGLGVRGDLVGRDTAVLQTRHVLWGLWDCLKGVVAMSGGGFPGTGEMQAGSCFLEMPEGTSLGEMQLRSRERISTTPFEVSETTTAGQPVKNDTTTNGDPEAATVFARSETQPGDKEGKDVDFSGFLPFSTAANTTGQAARDADQTTSEDLLGDRTDAIEARIYPVGRALQIADVAFTFLEGVIDMALDEATRPFTLPSDWHWEYDSTLEGVYVDLRARADQRGAQLDQASRALWALIHEMDVWNQWLECDFVVFVNRQPKFDGRLRRSVK